MNSSKVVRYTLLCVGVAALCLCFSGGGMVFRYFTAGVNPLRELKMATLGESIEVTEHFDQDGKRNRQLTIDGIDHGGQFQVDAKWKPFRAIVGPTPNWNRVPTTYYHTNGPVGMAFTKFNWFRCQDHSWHDNDARLPASLLGAFAVSPWHMLGAAWSEPPVGVVMMNNGTLAAYARPYQCFDVYERNPKIKELSFAKPFDLPRFTYIEDATKRGAHLRVLEGNERESFDRDAPKQFYHLLMVDTSRGHPGLPSKELLTKEAWKSYLAAMAEDGIICVHTSSRDFNLASIVASTASDLGLAHLRFHDPGGDRNIGHYASEWIMVARNAETLRAPREAGQERAEMNRHMAPHERKLIIEPLPGQPDHVWTDAGSNSLAGVRR